MTANLPLLIRALLDPARYEHPVGRVELIETHISWVILTGRFAYKIKKPVNLGFLDFSTLDNRRHYCQEELRLNRRLAPELYLDVVPITGDAANPVIGGAGGPIEYAVKMAQFPSEAQLDRVLARGGLQPAHTDLLARELAEFHARVAIADEASHYGDPDHVWQPVAENFSQIRARATGEVGARCGFGPADFAPLDRLEAWSIASFAALKDAIAARKRGGFVRECHGDAHLANMALLGEQIVLFDGIEFSDNLRWIDVASEIAFVLMDLDDRGHPALARRLLNTWLEQSGDFAALGVLRFYQVYRALVRAKVAAIRCAGASGERERIVAEYRGYIALAERYTRPAAPFLLITHGVSGSGKTFVTQRIIESLDAIRVRSDIERKRLFGLAPAARSGADVGAGIYTHEASARTYDRLASVAEEILASGFAAIVDATFLKRAERDRMRELAARRGAPFVILALDAPREVLRSRVQAREREARDASEAGIAVLERQLAAVEPLAAGERDCAIVLDKGDVTTANAALGALQRRLGA
jgi:aminoglycoside phosphotransferase family enzyme/gluconate kinase